MPDFALQVSGFDQVEVSGFALQVPGFDHFEVSGFVLFEVPGFVQKSARKRTSLSYNCWFYVGTGTMW